MANIDSVGLFLPTTFEFDIQRLYEVEIGSPEFRELIVRLYQTVNNIVIATNYKESGFYVLTEFVTGNLWYPDPTLNSGTPNTPVFRPTFRKVIQFGPLLNNATKSVAHGITMTTSFRMKEIIAVANKPTAPFSYIPINFINPAGDMLSLTVDGTNINITTVSVTINWTQYTDTDIILMYVKQ